MSKQAKISNLNIALVQTNLVWENKAKNITAIGKLLQTIKRADVIVLPEMFTTGFSMNTQMLAETMEGETVAWMKQQAKKKKAAICGSLIIAEGKKNYNRFVWAMPNGETYTYDKRHLFTPAGEDRHYTKGKEKICINYKGWNIVPFVCYDLRFPVWNRVVNAEADVLLYVANWPAVRVKAWEQLLKARAIENQAYVVGVNRVGKDAKDINHSGSSMAIDYLGEVLVKGATNKTWVKQVVLKHNEVDAFRKKLPFWHDADVFSIGK